MDARDAMSWRSRAASASASASTSSASTSSAGTPLSARELPSLADAIANIGRTRTAERAYFALTPSHSRSRTHEIDATVTLKFPFRFRGARRRGGVDVVFECVRISGGCFAPEPDADANNTSAFTIKASQTHPKGRMERWLTRIRSREAEAHAFGSALALQIAFPDVMTRVNRACAFVALTRVAVKTTEAAPRLGVLDSAIAVRSLNAALATTTMSAAARVFCPALHAHATAATALLSVKLLLKQPPWRGSLRRVLSGARGNMDEDARLALWHARYRWAALRLAKHVPSNPVRTIDAAPLWGVVMFLESVATRIGALNADDFDARDTLSMSWPTLSWQRAKMAKRRNAFRARRAIEAESRLEPEDILSMVRHTLASSIDTSAPSPAPSPAPAPARSNRALAIRASANANDAPGARSGDAERDADCAMAPTSDESDNDDDENNIWRDDRLTDASWATRGWSIALMVRAMYLLVTWLPVLTFAVPLLLASKGAPATLSVSMRKRAWSTLHSAIALCGAAFIKWAQWASTREDVFPKDLCEALQQLHDDAPQHSYRQTLRILAQELKCDPRLIFSQFPKKPIASGSVAQVYKARLRKEVAAACSDLAKPRKLELNDDGTLDVAVKVRHPNVAKRIFLDFQILRAVAGWADALPGLRGLHLRDTLGQFSHTMTAQTDLRNEADHLLKFTHNMKDEIQIKAPRPVPGFATEGVLIETFVKGDGLGRAIRQKSARNPELCSLGVHAYLLMLLRDNFMHQDLHPGNILYSVDRPATSSSAPTAPKTPEAASGASGVVKLELIDFGIADELPQSVRNKFIGFLCFILRGEGEKAADVALMWDTNQTCKDVDGLRRDMARLIATRGDVFTQRVDLDALLKDVMRLFRKYTVSIDGIYASLIVSLCVLVGFATSLDPNINLFEVATPAVMAYALTGNVVGRLFDPNA